MKLIYKIIVFYVYFVIDYLHAGKVWLIRMSACRNMVGLVISLDFSSAEETGKEGY